MSERGPNPDTLDSWTARDGEDYKITELTTAHLYNVIAFLYRNEGERSLQRPKLVSLEKELLKRLKKRYVS